ncbi:MAG: phosphomannomutase/phosphoglucomutase [Rhodocyclaceae bacterium]|nr:phosphomannomutase/phosphoglucomutase [Rhodocyclaceae bacterium]
MSLPAAGLFKAYDIRGVVDTDLTEDAVRQIGRAIGAEARARGESAVAIGRDGRLSGPALSAALAEGLQAAGVDVSDIGVCATPMLYFAVYHLGLGGGVMVTGSHNPPQYNGLKMVLAGETLAGDAIQGLRRRIEADDYGATPAAPGRLGTAAIRAAYLERICGDVKLARPLKVVVDCGNGSPGATVPELFRRLGCHVTELYCDVDGTFPNHHPDPSDLHNLRDLITELARGKADIGLAFDGDGDRLGVVTRTGKVIFPDRQLMLFAADVLARNPGAEILFDVKCTRHLFDWIRRHGGQPTLWKTGHSLIKAKMRETGALLAGEMSGHIFFKERWYGFDDGLYAGARLLEILARTHDIAAVFDALPDSLATPELQIRVENRDHHALINQLQQAARFPSAREVITLDGLRVEYADGFGLVRGSNTTPVLVLRFEADNAEALARIQDEFRAVLNEVGLAAGF